MFIRTRENYSLQVFHGRILHMFFKSFAHCWYVPAKNVNDGELVDYVYAKTLNKVNCESGH